MPGKENPSLGSVFEILQDTITVSQKEAEEREEIGVAAHTCHISSRPERNTSALTIRASTTHVTQAET